MLLLSVSKGFNFQYSEDKASRVHSQTRRHEGGTATSQHASQPDASEAAYESSSKVGRLPSRYRRHDHEKIFHVTTRNSVQWVKMRIGVDYTPVIRMINEDLVSYYVFACNDLTSTSSIIWVSQSRFIKSGRYVGKPEIKTQL